MGTEEKAPGKADRRSGAVDNGGTGMKIQEFSTLYGLSVRTVRYYVQLGLLRPGKREGQLFFDQDCKRELETILGLREDGFLLKEIGDWFSWERGEKPEGEIWGLKKELLRQVHRRVCEQEQKLDTACRELRQQIEELNRTPQHRRAGIHLNILPILCCPRCGGSLVYEDTRIEDLEIVKGKASCVCGYEAEIRDGIYIGGDMELEAEGKAGKDTEVETGKGTEEKTGKGTEEKTGKSTEKDTGKDEGRGMEKGPRIVPIDRNRETYGRLKPDGVSRLQKNFYWILKEIQSQPLKGKVILENFVNTICFLSTGILYLDPEAIYIIADSDLSVIRDIKARIETLDRRYQILYLVTDTLAYPLKGGSVDIVLDYFHTEIIQGFNISSLERAMAPYVHKGSRAVGIFTYIKKGSRTLANNRRKFPDSYRDRFILRALKEDLKSCGLVTLKEQDENTLTFSVIESYEEGDLLGEYCFLAEYR